MTEENKKEETPKPSAERTAKDGDLAKVHYTGSLETGEVFDSSKDRDPLEFEVGAGQLIKGFDKAVVGMKAGDKKELLLEPADAYGDRDDKKLQKIPRSQLPAEPEPKAGMMLTIKAPTGQVFPAKIDKVEGDMVQLDLNHPLAGKKLKFEIEVVEVKDKPEGAAKEESSCGCGDSCEDKDGCC